MPAHFKKLSIVVPAYNEESSIVELVERVRKADIGDLEREIVVVNDGSVDRTGAILETISGIVRVTHPANRGKGAAVKSGFRIATGDICLIQDGDLEYDPKEYRGILDPILAGRADASLGSRFVHERPVFFWGKRRSPFFTHYIGNLAIIALTNFLYGHDATDYEGGTKAFTKEAVDALPIEADGFEYDNELVCKMLRRRYRIAEVPISYTPRTYAEGKKINWRHGMRMLWTIVKWRFKSF